jgi:hypothetical protein
MTPEILLPEKVSRQDTVPIISNYQPHSVQQAAHKAFLVDGYDRGTLFWGRQVGKSLWSVKHLEMAAVLKQGQYFIVFDTHKHAKDVMWRQYLNALPKQIISDTNSSELIITLNYMKGPFYIPGIGWKAIKHNLDLAPSTIQLLGSDYADEHRGRKAEGIIFDEYQDQQPGTFEAVYEPFFSTTRGWAVFMGTPRGYNHWYDLLQYAKDPDNKRWFYSEATWRDNPAISKEFIEEARRDAEAQGMLDTHLQEYELQFRTLYGAVYPMFDRNIHVIPPNDSRIPQDGSLFITWDFGWAEGHPTAINFVTIDNTGKRWVTDEVHGTQIDFDDAIDMVVMRVAGRKVTAVIADSARPDLVELLRNKLSTRIQCPVIAAPKRQKSVESGIQLLGTKLKPKLTLVTLPEPEYYFTSNCKMTIYQFENYRYREQKGKDMPVNELPLKVNDDHPDGIRYLELYLKYGLVKDQKPIQSNLKLNQYGLPRL